MKASGYRYGLLDAYEHKENPWKEEEEGMNLYVVTGVSLVVISLIAAFYLHFGWFMF